MANKTINPYTDVALAEVDTPSSGQDTAFLSNLREINVGDGGSNVFRTDKQGIWLGSDKFSTAPFKVSMAGAVTATSIVITGGTLRYGKTSFTDSAHSGYYIGSEGLYMGKASDATILRFTVATGALDYTGKVVTGSGSDIGASYITGSITASQIGSVNATSISGSITASQIASVNASAISGSISSSQITSITAGQITGSITSTQIGSINAATITIGLIGNSQINSVSASKLTAGTIDASVISVINLNASNITAGTLRVGGGSQPTAIEIIRSTSSADGILRWTGGSKIFEDYSNYLGLTSTGERIYFYTGAANLYALFQRGMQASFYAGVSCQGNFNVGSSSTPYPARFSSVIYLYHTGYSQYIQSDNATINTFSLDQHNFYRGGSITAIIDANFWTAGDLYAGGTKPFVIPHPDGSARQLRYTAQESPDVVLRVRGRANLDEFGHCGIDLPKHFTLVTEPEGETTVNLTATCEEQGLFVYRIDKNVQISVFGKKPGTEFMYEVMAIRKGYLNYAVELEGKEMVRTQKI